MEVWYFGICFFLYGRIRGVESHERGKDCVRKRLGGLSSSWVTSFQSWCFEAIQFLSFLAARCSVWDLSSPTRYCTAPLAGDARSGSYWTTRQVPEGVWFYPFKKEFSSSLSRWLMKMALCDVTNPELHILGWEWDSLLCFGLERRVIWTGD